jgi:addiction module RelE/StbE family toxin
MASQTNKLKVKFSKEFIEHYKKANVRIRHQVDERIRLFKRNPTDLQLRNHSLRDNWKGYRSINISVDWRAIYKEIPENKNFYLAFFVALGTHKQLYR